MQCLVKYMNKHMLLSHVYAHVSHINLIAIGQAVIKTDTK